MLANLERKYIFLKSPENRLAIFLAFSFLLHLLFIKSNFPWMNQLASEDYPVQSKIELLDDEVAKELIKRVKRNPNLKKQQIVNNTLDGKKEIPAENRFLGEKDQTFDTQSIARKVDVFNVGGEGNSKSQSPSNDPSEKKSVPQKLKLSDLAIGPGIRRDLETENADKGIQGTINSVDKGKGISSNNDFIEDVPLGETTNLNTVEFKYYGFYHRIRQKLEQHWGNSLREKAKNLYGAGRRIAVNENYITSIRITINAVGEITDVKILGKSGVKELDEAAVESFNKAGPFPNPPSGLLKNGYAEIEWGFVVKS